MSKLLGDSLLASMGKRKKEENEMSKRIDEFLEKKKKIVELFLAEKTQCIPLSEIPKRCSKTTYSNGETYMVDGRDILKISTSIVNNKAAHKFMAVDFSEFDYKLLQGIVKEVMG